MIMVALSLLHVACVPAPPQSRPLRKPAALIAMQQARVSKIVSGRIEWSVLPGGDQKARLRFVSRYARNGDTIFENRGDPDGWTEFSNAARSGRGRSKFPLLYMKNSVGIWAYKETTPVCELAKWDRQEGMPIFAEQIREIRSVGISPTSKSLEDRYGFDIVWGSQPHRLVSWDETVEDGLHVVTATYQQGAKTIWRIDPDRGWNATRIHVEGAGGAVVWEAVCALKKYGDVWLPETTTYYREGKVIDVVRIDSAALNRPDDPRRFTGADLGLEPGHDVTGKNFPVDPRVGLRWNGEELVTRREWDRDVKAGRRDWGPIWKPIIAGEGWTSPYDTKRTLLSRQVANRDLQRRAAMVKHESAWTRYMREFISRFALDEEQSQAARAILKDCKQRAERLRQSKRAELVRTIDRLYEARRDGKREDVKRLADRLRELEKPIAAIFEKQLKPRLDALPTQAQRQAAEKTKAQPAKP